MDLYILNEIQKLKSGGLPSSGGDGTGVYGIESTETTTDLDGWVSFYGVNLRQHHDNHRWTTNNYEGATFYVYGANGASDFRLGFWNSTGDPTYGPNPNNHNSVTHRRICYATKNNLGYSHQLSSMYSSQAYGPFSTNIMFVRNPTDTDITVNIDVYYSNGWNNGYEGSCLWTATPNTNAYSTVSSFNWNNRYNQSSGVSFYSGTGNSVVFPANTTVIVGMQASMYWWTSSYQAGLWLSDNRFTNISTLSAAGLECDHKLSQTYYSWHDYNNRTNMRLNQDTSIAAIYHQTAALFGDR